VDAVNELTNVTRTGTLTFSGATPTPATNVTVNGLAARICGNFTYARTNLALLDGSNTFSNVARNIYGVAATNTLTLNVPQSVKLSFDNNGNLTNDGLHLLTLSKFFLPHWAISVILIKQPKLGQIIAEKHRCENRN
jgi:hypothetical protein